MLPDCEVEGPGDFEDASFGNGFGNDGIAGFAERGQRGPVALNGTIGKATCGLSRRSATNAIKGVQGGLGFPAVPFRFDEIAQIIAPKQHRPFRIHHMQTFRHPISDCASGDIANVRPPVSGKLSASLFSL